MSVLIRTISFDSGTIFSKEFVFPLVLGRFDKVSSNIGKESLHNPVKPPSYSVMARKSREKIHEGRRKPPSYSVMKIKSRKKPPSFSFPARKSMKQIRVRRRKTCKKNVKFRRIRPSVRSFKLTSLSNSKYCIYDNKKYDQRGGLMDKSLGLCAGRSGVQIPGRGKCSLRTIAFDARVNYPLFYKKNETHVQTKSLKEFKHDKQLSQPKIDVTKVVLIENKKLIKKEDKKPIDDVSDTSDDDFSEELYEERLNKIFEENASSQNALRRYIGNNSKDIDDFNNNNQVSDETNPKKLDSIEINSPESKVHTNETTNKNEVSLKIDYNIKSTAD